LQQAAVGKQEKKSISESFTTGALIPSSFDAEVDSQGKMPAIAFRSEYLSQLKKKPNQIDIYLMCFFHKVSYGFELVPMMNNFIFTENV